MSILSYTLTILRLLIQIRSVWPAKALCCSGNDKKNFVQSVFHLWLSPWMQSPWSRSWLGVGCRLSVFQVLPYRTSSRARFRGLEPCSFSPTLHTDRSFSAGLACTLTLSHLPHRINLSSVQTVSSDALARTAHTLLLPPAGTAGASARLHVAL